MCCGFTSFENRDNAIIIVKQNLFYSGIIIINTAKILKVLSINYTKKIVKQEIIFFRH